MLLKALGDLENAPVTLATKILTRGPHELRRPLVRSMTGRAASRSHRRMQDRQAGAGSDTGVTLAAEIVFAADQERLPSGPVGIVAGDTLVRGRRVNDRGLGQSGVLMAPHTEVARAGRQQGRVR